jgi:hypothetical protein
MRLVLALAAVVVLAPPAAASVQVRASIELVSNSPFVVAGTGFRPAEQVRLVAYRGAVRTTRTVSATRRGTFRVRLAASAGAGCAVVAVTATGSKGSRAALKIMPLCPQPPAG